VPVTDAADTSTATGIASATRAPTAMMTTEKFQAVVRRSAWHSRRARWTGCVATACSFYDVHEIDVTCTQNDD